MQKFFKEVVNWKNQSHISSHDYPNEIYFDSKIWTVIRRLRQYSDRGSQRLLENNSYLGSLGYEYAATLAYIIDDIYISEIVRGTWQSVKTKVSMEVKHEILKDGSGKVKQIRKLNGVIVGTKTYINTEIHNSDLRSLGVVANIHTHPKFKVNHNGKFGYGFFSAQDINQILKTDMFLSGLVTDKFWLIGKTSNSSMPSIKLLEDLSLIDHDKDEFSQKSKALFKKHNLVLYKAESFGRPIIRII